jgi:hypothetical protein
MAHAAQGGQALRAAHHAFGANQAHSSADGADNGR